MNSEMALKGSSVIMTSYLSFILETQEIIRGPLAAASGRAAMAY
jgi:hypothetical protein